MPSKICWHINSKMELVLSYSCSSEFAYTIGGRLFYATTEKCITASGTQIGAPLVLSYDCFDEKSVWTISGISLKNPSSNKCAHVTGDLKPQEGQQLTLSDSCGKNRDAFKFLLSKLMSHLMQIYFGPQVFQIASIVLTLFRPLLRQSINPSALL